MLPPVEVVLPLPLLVELWSVLLPEEPVLLEVGLEGRAEEAGMAVMTPERSHTQHLSANHIRVKEKSGLMCLTNSARLASRAGLAVVAGGARKATNANTVGIAATGCGKSVAPAT